MSSTILVMVRRVLALLLVLAAVAWVLGNKSVEGPTLLVLSAHHGITAADLVSVPASVLALVIWPWGHRRRPRNRVR